MDENWVHNIKNESERMVKLVTELLDLAKTEQDMLLNENNLSNIIKSSVLTCKTFFLKII